MENLGRVKNLVGFTPDMLRHMCILSGCDYLPSIKGVGLVKSCNAIKSGKTKDIHHVSSNVPSVNNNAMSGWNSKRLHRI